MFSCNNLDSLNTLSLRTRSVMGNDIVSEKKKKTELVVLVTSVAKQPCYFLLLRHADVTIISIPMRRANFS